MTFKPAYQLYIVKYFEVYAPLWTKELVEGETKVLLRNLKALWLLV